MHTEPVVRLPHLSISTSTLTLTLALFSRRRTLQR